MGRVRLHSLQLTGFKSFPDRVVVDFPTDTAAILGPNGCGKSNLVDAILWVLGEQSPKLLRLKNMGDVVFSGAAGRPPAGAAEVALSLRSDDGRWESSAGSLLISRRVYRSGPSEYRLNGKIVRLKDVVDELLGLGLGTRSYAIIEQGRVGQVLSARPTDRRALLEEAAGITRYKVRRHEAELKLEQTRQNLLRLDDVISEVDRTLRALRRQARQAERYRKMETQLRLQLQTAALASAEADLAGARSVHDEGRDKVESARGEVSTLLASRERLEAFLERSADLLDSLRSSLERTRAEREAATSARGSMDEQLGATEATLAAREGALAEVRQDLEQAAAEHEAARTALEEADREAGQRRQELLRAISELTSSRNRERDLEREQDRLTYVLQKLASEGEQLEARREQVAGRFAEAREQNAAASGAVKELEGRRTDLVSQRAVLREEVAQAAHDAEALTHGAWELRHELTGVEREMARQAAAVEQVTALLPEEAIAGLVSDYLHPDPGVAPILDRVWREWLELPVIREDRLGEIAPETVADLEVAIRLAVAGDVPELGDAPEPDQAEPLLPLAGAEDENLGWLARVVPPAYRCESAETSRRLADQHPWAVFLSPDGVVVRGRCVELPTAGARLRGALELRELKRNLQEQLDQATRQAEEEQGRQADAAHKLDGVEEALALVGRELLEAEQEGARAAAVEQALGEELDRLERELDAVADEVERSRGEQRDQVAEKARLEALVAGLMEQTSRMERSVEAAAAAVEERRTGAADSLRRLDRWRADERMADERVEGAGAELSRLRTEAEELEGRLEALCAEVGRLEGELEATEDEVVRSRTRLAEDQGLLASARDGERRQSTAVEEAATRVSGLESEVAARREAHDQARTALHEVEVEQTRAEADWDRIREGAANELGLAMDVLLAEPPAENADPEAIRAEVEVLRAKLDKLGPVNLLAIREVDELKERSTFLHAQRKDLVESLRSLEVTIRDIDATCTERFLETYQQVNEVFNETFHHLFGGGTARLELVDEDDPLESGIDITAQPPGKKTQSVLLLSGGEKALTALSLLIALFRIRPSPFCILDEVDAPLDDANVERLADLIQTMTEHTQFVLITHNRRTMARADTLYGVTMEEAGVSKVVSVRMEDA